MKFKKAIEHLKRGNFIKRKNWDNYIYMQFPSGDALWGGTHNHVNLNLSDIFAKDWELDIDKPVEYFYWAEACKRVLNGKRVARKYWTKGRHMKMQSQILSYDDDSDFIVSADDLEATDWYEVTNEEN